MPTFITIASIVIGIIYFYCVIHLACNSDRILDELKKLNASTNAIGITLNKD